MTSHTTESLIASAIQGVNILQDSTPVTLGEVERAIHADELVPSFQPLVDLRSGRVTGFEVLARWNRPQFGLTLPADFISLAERHDLIGKLTFSIVRKAIQAVSALSGSTSISVNISPVLLQDLGFPEKLREVVEKEGYSLSQITAEITETALLDNMEVAVEVAQRLKGLGCRLSMDDCGTGYSSLLHLQALPFDEIKVDRSFVKNMTCHRESRKIVAAVVGLGLSLGMRIVAEGVETHEQSEMLLMLGCQVGQGYLFGHPAPLDRFSKMVSSGFSLGRLSVNDSRSTAFHLESLPAQHLAQLRAIYDGSPAGLYFLDCDMRYVSVNRAMAEIHGIPISEHLGKKPAELIPEIGAQIEPFLLHALAGTATKAVEVSRSGPAGERRYFFESFQPIYDEAGEVAGVSVAVIDITERKHTECHQSSENVVF